MAPGMANMVNKAMAKEKENASNGSVAGSTSRSSRATVKTDPTKKKKTGFPLAHNKTSSPTKGSGSTKRRPSSSSASVSISTMKNTTASPPTSSPSTQNMKGDNWVKKVPGVKILTAGVNTGVNGVATRAGVATRVGVDAGGDSWDMVMAGVKVAAAINKDVMAQRENKLFQRDLVSAVTWEIFAPPPTNSVSGKFVPRVLNKYRYRRMFSMEVHHVTPLFEEGVDNVSTGAKGGTGAAAPLNPSTTRSYEECVARIFYPESKEMNRKLRREALLNLRKGEGTYHEYGDSLESNDFDDDDDDDVTVEDTMDPEGQVADHGGKHYNGWKPKYSLPIGSVTIRQQQKKTVHILIAIANVKEERDLLFDTVDDAQKFCREVEGQQKLENDRQEMRLQASLRDIKLPNFETITLLFEIVSAYDLPVGDFTTSDPYVVAMIKHRVIHRTKHIPNTLDPIWTLKTGSLFLLTIESKKLFLEEGLNFAIKDFDQFGKDETLGVINVNPRIIYLAQGERTEFKILPPSGSKSNEVPGYLVIRCRRASEYDQKFMADYESLQGGHGVASYDHPRASTSLVKTLVTWNRKKDKDGTIKYKIRPNPDPARPHDTEWMTDKTIQAEVLKPSIHWTEIGHGDLAKVYLEILGCDSLPNMDTGGFLGNKTDSFVSLVYEDCYIRTDTIDDCLSPRWMPWTNRAFVLSMAHTSSQIFIGVFDFDDSPIGDHDLVGRVSVDLSNLRRDTEYVLGYNLYPSGRVCGRDVMGKITIRLRIEIPDERKLVIASLEPPPPVYVNVQKKVDFAVIRQTCLGKIDEDKYSVATLKSYIDELKELQYAFFYLEDALMTLFLWRSHFECRIFGHELALPVHSFNAFVVAVFLVEHPQLFPSFFFASLGWILIAVMGFRRSNPNVWIPCYSYAEILKKLVLGDALVPPHSIKPYENIEEVNEATENWVRRIEDAEKKAARDATAAKVEEQERLREMEEIGAEVDIATKVNGGISIDPVRAALYPIQLMLGMVCRTVRLVKNIFIWQEAYISFWITTGSLVLAIACVFVPWFWLIKWTSRFIVWTLFGPWMKLVDIYYVSLVNPETDEERERRERAEKLKRKLASSEAISKARQVRENATKMKVLKKYMFGKFSMRIPILKQDRYPDIPLPESMATPFKDKEFSLGGLSMEEAGYHRTIIPGQTLVGDMIPSIVTDTNFTQAPVGKATAHPEKLAKDAPGARDKPAMDTTTAAYVKIGTAVSAACIVSFFGTPILVKFLSTISGKGEL